MMVSPDEWRTRGDWFSFRGHRLFFRHEGTGEPLVLLHGFPTSSWDWAPLWEELAARYHVIALDYLGFGFSDKPTDGNYRIAEYADEVTALLGHLGVAGPVHLFAHDLGDTVAQELMARDEPALASVCLLNGGLFPEVHRARLVQKLLASPLGFLVARLIRREAFCRSMVAVFGRATPPSPAELEGFWACVSYNQGLRNYHRLIGYMAERRANRDRWAAPIVAPKVPLRLVSGLADPVSGAHVVARLRALVPDADIVELPGIGHYPQTEAPQAVANAYREFRAREHT